MLTVTIPALNEEENIGKTLAAVIAAADHVRLKEFEIIVVNDGSTDRTGEIVRSFAQKYGFIRVIENPRPRGIGQGFLDCVDIAKYDRITTFAGDNNTHWSLIVTLFKNYDKADILTSYFINTEVRSRSRNLLSTIFTTIFVTIFDLHVKYINGNFVFPVSELKKMTIHSRGYNIFAEIKTKLLRSDLTFLEVPGWSNPHAQRSQALRLKHLINVSISFLRTAHEILISKRQQYSKRARRVGMPPLDPVHFDPEILNEAEATATLGLFLRQGRG